MASTTRSTCCSWRARAAPGRAFATRAATCGSCRRAGAGASTRCVNLFTSFGFFTEPADDARVIAEFARVLAPGGVLIWHGGNRDGVMARFLARDWWTTEDGTLVAHERSFDPLSGLLTIRSTFRGAARQRGARAPHPPLHRDSAGRADGRAGTDRRAVPRRVRPVARSRRTSGEMLLVARKE